MSYDSTRASLAYAERGIPKLRQELASEQLISRQKALVTLSDLMHDAERVHEAVRTGCLQQIIQLLQDTDETVRFLSVTVLNSIVQYTVGREAFLKQEGLPILTTLFNDNSEKIKLQAFVAMDELSNLNYFAREIAASGLAMVLVNNHLTQISDDISGESLRIVLIAMSILQKLLFISDTVEGDVNNNNNEDSDKAKEAAIKIAQKQDENTLITLQTVNNLIENSNAEIKSAACVTLHDLCCNRPLAKEYASKNKELIQLLVNSIDDKNNKMVRIASCQALMTICICTSGKLLAFDTGVCEKLLILIDEAIEVSENIDDATREENDSLRLNAIRAVQVVAEVPSARTLFSQKHNVSKIRSLEENTKLSSDVRRAARETIAVIEWMP